ncbi:hypothetical protein B0H13DRAFT_2280074 [Mycena leptocephala]|nr:hypothetical protein B0H13DRAFT_2280074 [Mycena leptocephala]
MENLNVRLGGNGEHGGEGGVGEAPTFHANVVHFENMNGPSAILAVLSPIYCHALLKREGKGVDEIEAGFDAVEEARPHHDIWMKDIGTLRGSPEAQEFSVERGALVVAQRHFPQLDTLAGLASHKERIGGEFTFDIHRFFPNSLSKSTDVLARFPGLRRLCFSYPIELVGKSASPACAAFRFSFVFIQHALPPLFVQKSF